MRYVIFWTVALTLLFYATARADEGSVSFKYGLGIIDGAPTTRVKAFGLRLEDRPSEIYPLGLAAEAGLWTDVGKAEGRASSAYGAFQMGIRPASEHFYVKAYIGPAFITHRDSQLGGFFPQFMETLGLGFQDRDAFVGVSVDHISSAGIWSPNKGRDMLRLEAGLRW